MDVNGCKWYFYPWRICLSTVAGPKKGPGTWQLFIAPIRWPCFWKVWHNSRKTPLLYTGGEGEHCRVARGAILSACERARAWAARFRMRESSLLHGVQKIQVDELKTSHIAHSNEHHHFQKGSFQPAILDCRRVVQFDQIDKLGLGPWPRFPVSLVIPWSHGGTNGSSFNNMFSARSLFDMFTSSKLRKRVDEENELPFLNKNELNSWTLLH